MNSQKPCLVLVHGFLGGSAQWNLQQKEWHSKFHVVAIDLPGYGLKHSLPAPTRIEDFAEAVLAELSDMGIQKFNLLGHSMGGMIVQAMVQQAPKRVTKLVLYGTGAIGSLPGRFEPIAESIRKAQIDGAYATSQRIASNWFLEGVEAQRYPVCAELAAMASLQAVLAGLSAMEAWSGVHRLPHIKQPSLIIWGDADATYTWHQTEQLWQQIQSSQLAVLPHCGHAAHLEKPTLFNAMVSDFLQS